MARLFYFFAILVCCIAFVDPPVCAETHFEPRTFRYSDSVKVAFDVSGNGDLPLVLLHSLGSAKESWDPLMPGLLAVCKCRIYRLDFKGHGDTSAPNDHRYSLHENSAIVRAFLADQGLHGAILMGHSYGGAVALNLALDAKDEKEDLLSGLILIGTPGVWQKFPFLVAHHRYEAYGQLVDHLTTPKFRAWVAVHARGGGRNPTQADERVQLYARLWSDPARSHASRETARQFLDGGGLAELGFRDHDAGIPTLLIAGHRDNIVGVKHIRRLAQSIESSKLSIIPKAGHAPHEDRPESVVPVISEFLNTIDTSAILPGPR